MVSTLKEAIAKHSHVEGNCLVWDGAMRRGRPLACLKVSNDKYKLVDIYKYLGEKFLGNEEGKQYSFSTTCGNPRCINRQHLLSSIKHTKRSQLNVTGRTVGLMENNKAVFDLLVTDGIDTIAKKTGLSVGLIQYMRKQNVAMNPYFFMKIKWYLGEDKLNFIRESEEPRLAVCKMFKISRFAYDFIKTMYNIEVHDEDLYVKLLDGCEVVGEHLVWIDKFNALGVPVTSVFDQYERRALSVFMYAFCGYPMDETYKTNSIFKNCVNPLFVEVEK